MALMMSSSCRKCCGNVVFASPFPADKGETPDCGLPAMTTLGVVSLMWVYFVELELTGWITNMDPGGGFTNCFAYIFVWQQAELDSQYGFW
jgi:hypothetical protein